MRLLILAIVLAVALGYVLGGRLRRLEHLRLRWWALVLAGFGVQFLPLPEGDGGTDLFVRAGVLALSYGLLLAFALANIRLPGAPLVFLGLACNALVIVSNGGMPVSEEALRHSGQSEVAQVLVEGGAAKHHLMEDDDALTFLADVIPVSAPVNQVISIGDVLVYAGLLWLIVASMRERTPTESSTGWGQWGSLGRHRPGATPSIPPSPPDPPPAARTSGSGP
jgi:hypothetical protein